MTAFKRCCFNGGVNLLRPSTKVFFGPNMTYFNGTFSGVIGSFDELAPGGMPGMPNTGPSDAAAVTPSSSGKKTNEVMIKPSVTLFKDANGIRIGKLHVLATFGIHIGSDDQKYDIHGQLDIVYPCDAGESIAGEASFSADAPGQGLP